MENKLEEIQLFLISNLPEYRCRFKGRLNDYKQMIYSLDDNESFGDIKNAFERECKFDIAVDIQYRASNLYNLDDILIVLECVDIEKLLLLADSMMDEQTWIQ